MGIVVVGLGSPFLSDDSVGPRVIRLLAQQGMEGVRLVESYAGGLLLLEELTGAERAVIVDAVLDERRTPGEIVISGMAGASNNATCSHDCSLAETLALGRTLGMQLPPDELITLVGVVAADVTTVSEQLSEPVAAALDQVCQTVRGLFQT